jgi:hypothetical protein
MKRTIHFIVSLVLGIILLMLPSPSNGAPEVDSSIVLSRHNGFVHAGVLPDFPYYHEARPLIEEWMQPKVVDGTLVLLTWFETFPSLEEWMWVQHGFSRQTCTGSEECLALVERWMLDRDPATQGWESRGEEVLAMESWMLGTWN